MITFYLSFTTGQTYQVTDNINNSFIKVVDTVLIEKNMINKKIKTAIMNANKIDIFKSLLDNKITNNSRVIVLVEDKPQQKYNNNNFNNTNNSLKKNFWIKKPSMLNLPLNLLNTQASQSTPNIFNNTNNFQSNNHKNNFNLQNNNKYVPLKTLNNIFIPKPLNINLNNNNISQYLPKAINIIINGCNVPSTMLDSRGNCVGEWSEGRKNGPPGYLKDYYPPYGWTGIGLKALDLYDNRDNTWIGTTNQNGEWYIAYHAVKTINSIYSILKNGFRRGPFQYYKNYPNLNPLTNNFYPFCGEGVYFMPNFLEVKDNGYILTYSGVKFRIIFMCRINPYKVRIVNNEVNQEFWVVNGDRLDDIYGKKRDDEVRPCRLLIHFENN